LPENPGKAWGNVAILGHGVTGKAVAEFLRARGIPFTIYDQFARPSPPDAVESIFRPERHGLAIHSPGFFRSPWLWAARSRGCPCLGEVDFASLFLANPSIAVTGTNGKTSTVLMLAHVLNKLGWPARISGNVGCPLIAQVEAFWADAASWNICEISSYQARRLEIFSPSHVIWTNFAPNHLDTHGSLEKYFLAKWNLLRRCQKSAWVGPSVAQMSKKLGLALPPTVRVFDPAGPARSVGEVLSATHQLPNFMAIGPLLSSLGFSDAAVEAAIRDHTPPPHRLCHLGTANGMEIWNDSKATNAHAVSHALGHVTRRGHRCIWITGGRTKGEGWKDFPKIVERVDGLIGFGEMGKVFAARFPEKLIAFCPDGEGIFPAIGRMVAKNRGRERAILFSPGFSSFDLFANYGERGEWFTTGVQRFFKK
jgi:UDP-N-acetylmuramoylalanine--D-glutamate ligase